MSFANYLKLHPWRPQFFMCRVVNEKMEMTIMPNKMAMRRLLLFGNLIIFILLIFLIYDTILNSSLATLYSSKTLMKMKGKNQQGEDDKIIMELNMRRLVRGNDREELEATGFACHTDPNSDVCVSTKQVIIDTKSQTIHITPSNESTTQIKHKHIRIKPYPTKKQNPKALKWVTPLHIVQQPNFTKLPKCEFYHNVPALVFSSGGYAGNMFHGINDVIIPLFITSHHFRTQIRFVIFDYKPYWVEKFGPILRRLSGFETINVTKKNASVHCFDGGVVGVKYHKNLGLNYTDIPNGYKFEDFRKILFESYNLKYYEILLKPNRPILVLISRRKSRVFLNEDEMVKMMKDLGFEVIIALANEMENLNKFSKVVNSCHVMVGAHGAGLTNEVFLPKGGVVIQVVPIGLNWASNTYYFGPSIEMGLNHLKYEIGFNESSLSQSYGPNDVVISNPSSVFAKGYMVGRKIYLSGQNMTIDLPRLRKTLIHSLHLLRQQ